MRRSIGGAFISLDGVVQAPGGSDEDKTGCWSATTSSRRARPGES